MRVDPSKVGRAAPRLPHIPLHLTARAERRVLPGSISLTCPLIAG